MAHFFKKKTHFQELVHSVQVKEVMIPTEEEKIQVATDLAEAVYFLHGHSPVFLSSNVVGWEPWSSGYGMRLVFQRS